MSHPRPTTPAPNLSGDADSLDAATDQAIAACGDPREAVKALLIAKEFLKRELEERVSRGYIRGVKHGKSIHTQDNLSP
ncbi:hypothetical protein EAS56_17705 [Bradyrhizobium guangzhouense]|uniref:IS256 family transposase n=1 Tax=Bradyrhizobium guangzhouense TaxID=1325095 RepID=A0ABY0E4X7_9BRAD|nr:hypothetical protein EAS56_17705 [Bradyrhizobium guangzhouense]